MKVLQILILILGLVVCANAQKTEKLFVLSGTVYDSVKAVVSAVKLTAKNDGHVFNTTSDSEGTYKIELPFGKYTFEFNSPGFIPYVVLNFENLSETNINLDVNFLVAECSDCGSDYIGKVIEDVDKPTIIYSTKFNPKTLLNAAPSVLVKGLVKDEMGAVVPFADVRLRDIKGRTFQTKSNDNGAYKINLPPGIFRVWAEVIINKMLLKNKVVDIEIKNLDEQEQDLILYCKENGKKRCPTIHTDYCG